MAEGWSLPVLRGKLGYGVRNLETSLLQQGLQDNRPSKQFLIIFKIGKKTIEENAPPRN